MRISTLFLVFTTVSSLIQAIPLSFERRDAGRFLTRFGEQTVEVRADRLVFSGVTLRFHGARAGRMEGLGNPAPSTYISGRDASATFRQYPRLAVRGLYPGVDAVFYGNDSKLEYDLEVAPGAAPERIRIAIDGARRVRIDDNGDLEIDSWRQLRPRVHQKGREIAASYVLSGRNEVAIRLGAYDRRAPLTIDPVLAYTRAIGKGNLSNGTAVATDAQGNIYITGTTNAADFPTTAGALQARPTPGIWALSEGGKTKAGISISASNVGVIGGTPDGSVLYAATFNGIQVSGDGGATWRSAAPLPVTNTTPADTLTNAITVDSLDPATVLVATSVGLFGSTDGGQSWYPRTSGLAVSSNLNVSTIAVQYHPTNPLVAYAITLEPGYVYRSLNAGATWQILNPTYPGEPAPPTYPTPRLAMALSADGDTLYVINGNGTLLKTTDQGATWTRLAQNAFYTPVNIAVDPHNPATIYVLDLTALRRSTDGGATFQTILSANTTYRFALDASGAVYVANYDAVQVSTDGGTTLAPVTGIRYGSNVLSQAGGRVFAGNVGTSSAVVVKLDPTGSTILYSTYVTADPTAIAVSAAGEAVLVGSAYSPDVTVTVTPTRLPSPSIPMAQVYKLSADGTRLVYSRLIGGSGWTFGQAVAVDAAGAAIVGGSTRSTDLPTTSGALQQALPAAKCTRPQSGPFMNADMGVYGYVNKISADGASLLYSTYLTGACGSSVLTVAVDAAGNALLGGWTTSLDFPVSGNSYQKTFPGSPDQPGNILTMSAGYVSKLSAAGDKLLASTYLGGGYSTQTNAITFDGAGNPVIVGATQGMDKGATTGAYKTVMQEHCTPVISIGPGVYHAGTNDAFVLKLDPDLTAARFLTYLGGGCDDSANGVAVDAGGNVWVSGNSVSTDFPLRDPFVGGGNYSASVPGFLTQLSADASTLLFSSFSDSSQLVLNGSSVFQAGANAGVLSLWRLDPTGTTPVHVDQVTPATGYPPILLPPSRQGIAPGQYVELKGRNLGPATKVDAAVDSTGRMPFTLAGVTVKFGNIPAPLISVQAESILCFAPFEVTGSTKVTVSNNGQASNAVRMGIDVANPQVLLIVNADGTVNSAEHPAKLGTGIAAFVAGMGATAPLSVDGLVNSDPLPVPLATVFVNWMGTQLTPSFVGGAPGMVAGIIQVNVQLPSTAPAGASANPSTIYFGGMAKLWVAQ